MADAQIQMQQTAESVPGTTPLVHTWEEYRGYRNKEDPDVTIPWTGAVVNLDTQILCEGGPFDPRGVVTCDKLCFNK